MSHAMQGHPRQMGYNEEFWKKKKKEKFTSALLTMLKTLTLWITTNC